MKLTLQQRADRIRNLKAADAANTKCGRRLYIRNYLSGFAIYEDAPAWDADTFERLKALADDGVDAIILPAMDCETATAKRFTDLCHYFGLRALLTVNDWAGAPDADWRAEGMLRILETVEQGGFDGIVADMRLWQPQTDAAHDPQLEDALWQLYTAIGEKGGILVLCTHDGNEPACIDRVYDYLWTENASLALQTQGFVLPRSDSFAAGIPYLQLPLLTKDNRDDWKKYSALYAPMTGEVTLAYLDLQECADITSELTHGIHASMYVNDVKYLAVANLTENAYALTLAEPWTDRQTGGKADSYEIQPGGLLLLEK